MLRLVLARGGACAPCPHRVLDLVSAMPCPCLPRRGAAARCCHIAAPARLPIPLGSQALLSGWQDNQRLWLLATPAASAAALELGALVEAVQSYHARKQQGGPHTGPWLVQHYEAMAAALAALNTAALVAATVCLLAAAIAAASGSEDAAGSPREPLLAEHRGRGKHGRSGGPWDGSRRMRLVQGTLRYLVPDTLPLKLRWAGDRPNRPQPTKLLRVCLHLSQLGTV